MMVDDIHRDNGATARGRAPGRGSPPLAPSQGREQETTIAVLAGSGPRIRDGDIRARGTHYAG